MRKVLDIIFAHYQWYRRWSGGTWYHVEPKAFPEIKNIWVRDYAPSFEELLEQEDYGS